MAIVTSSTDPRASEAGPSSPPTATGKSPRQSSSLELPSLQPLSHTNAFLSAEDFDADAFLLTRAHIPLEELRGELREYLGQLREELVQLINDDYEEFISLGTGLRGEEERLIRLGKPLTQLSEEVGGVREMLLEQQVVVQGKLDQRAALREEKALLDLLQRLFDALSRAEALLANTEETDRAKLVDRLASEYTQLKYLVEKAQAENCKIVDSISPRIEKIKSSISRDLSTLLVDALRDESIKHLRQCFRTYDLISGLPEATEVIQKEFQAFCKQTIVAPAANDLLSPVVPETPSATSDTYDKIRLKPSGPLTDVLNRVLVHVHDLRPLIISADEVNLDILSEILWPVISSSIVSNLGNTIFAAGRPDDLHKHYTTVHRFMTTLESLAPSYSSISTMRQSTEYMTFERRWQLPVYFQLRWKEIVGTLEAALASSTPVESWALPQTGATWKAWSTCWSSNVFIPELAPRFWRLSLQIIARLGSWYKTTVDGFVITEEDISQEEPALKMAASGLMDIQQFWNRISQTALPIGMSPQEHSSLPSQHLEDKLITILTRRCTEPLKLVRSVASQFRAAPAKSTDSTPQPSYYVPTVFKPLQTLYSSRPPLRDQYGAEWSTTISESVFFNYASILASVRKTEDLLRRHRKSKKNTFSLFGGGGGGGGKEEVEGEEERFRRQMMADAEGLRGVAEGLGVDVASSAGYKELVEVINRPAE